MSKDLQNCEFLTIFATYLFHAQVIDAIHAA